MSVKWRCFIALYNKLESTKLKISLAAGLSNQVSGQFCYFCSEPKTEFEFLMSQRNGIHTWGAQVLRWLFQMLAAHACFWVGVQAAGHFPRSGPLCTCLYLGGLWIRAGQSSASGWTLDNNLEIDDPEQSSKSATLAKRAQWKDENSCDNFTATREVSSNQWGY